MLQSMGSQRVRHDLVTEQQPQLGKREARQCNRQPRIRPTQLWPGWERSPGGGNGNPLQYSALENPMACIGHGVTKSRTQLSD